MRVSAPYLDFITVVESTSLLSNFWGAVPGGKVPVKTANFIEGSMSTPLSRILEQALSLPSSPLHSSDFILQIHVTLLEDFLQ